MGEPKDKVPDASALGKLPLRTRRIYEILLEHAIDGVLEHTLVHLAWLVQISRRALGTHLCRMREAGVLLDVGTVARAKNGEWMKRRRFVDPFPNPLPKLPKPPASDSLHTYIQSTEGYPYPKGVKIAQPVQVSQQVYTCSLRSDFVAATRTLSLRSAGGEEMDELEQILSTGVESRRVELSHLPPYPSAGLYEPVRVPRMPRFSGQPDADARLLVKAYKAACMHRYGRRPRVDGRVTFRMRAVVPAMRKARIDSPYAWAAFRLMQWMYSEKAQKKPPGIDYVFSKKVVEDNHGHFKSKAESYEVLKRVMLTPSHQKLLELWERCRRAAACPSPAGTGEDVTRSISAKILPEDLYQRLASRIAGERAEAEADLYRRLANGEWVW